MRSIIKLTASHFAELHDSLLRRFDPGIPEAIYRRAFVPRGWSDEEHSGYALVADGKMVGVLGTLFSQRPMGDRVVRFCNLHCWYVLPEYRGHSLLLMRHVLALKDHVILDISPSPDAAAISLRLGFEPLDHRFHLLPPLPGPPAWHEEPPAEALEFMDLTASPELSRLLPGEVERRMFEDHADLDCGHTLVKEGSDFCYLVHSRVDRAWKSHVTMQHVSDPAFLARRHASIRSHLLRAGERYVAVPALLMGGVSIPRSFLVPDRPKLWRAPVPPPATLDFLYTEVPIFKLPAFPRPPEKLIRIAKRVLRRNGSRTK